MRREEMRGEERRSGIVCVGLKCERGKREKRGLREREKEKARVVLVGGLDFRV